MAARAVFLLAGALLLLVACAPKPAEQPPPPPPAAVPDEEPLRLARADIGRVDSVLVDKGARRLFLLRAGTILAWAPVGLGREPVGAKREQGDLRTPEGDYLLDWRNPVSRFHRSIHISYPNEADLAQALARDVNPGGAIFIHGTPDRVLLGRDWTTGCIAVANEDMDLIWQLVPDGTPITIRP
ncbi:MAG: L,D-transpeptidase family protein [Alphaproteobacteria bacterium]|nr:L,D-transpeptidase family protein [Alphaproteobacteria bacterium]